jgi:prevent-host-death family protein
MREQDPVTQTMKISDVKNRLSSLVNEVYRKETRVLVEKSGIPVAALVSAEDLARLARLDRERQERRQLLDRMRAPFKGIPPEQIEADVAAVVAEVRAGMAAEHEPVAAER